MVDSIDLNQLLDRDIPDSQMDLRQSQTNLIGLANYCSDEFLGAPDKNFALQETKNYCTQSLASVAYQINMLATNFLAVLEIQANQLKDLDDSLGLVAENVAIHKEKVARREIGYITTPKTIEKLYKISANAKTEQTIKYQRKPVDFSSLDDIGHGIKIKEEPGPFYSTMRRYSTTTDSGMSSTLRRKQFDQSNPQGTLRIKPTGAPSVLPPKPPSTYQPGSVAMQSMQREKYGTMSGKSGRSQQISADIGLPVTEVAMKEESRQRPPSEASYDSSRRFETSSECGSNVSDYRVPGEAFLRTPSVTMSENSGSSTNSMLPHFGYSGGHTQPGILNKSKMQSAMGVPQGVDYIAGSYMPQMSYEPKPEVYEPHYPNAARHQKQAPPPVMYQPQMATEQVIALYDYTAERGDELTFTEGEKIFVIKKNEDGWFEGYLENGHVGLFPGNYVETIG